MTDSYDWSPGNRPLKHTYRAKVFQQGNMTPRKVALVLPSAEAFDVRLALSYGVFSREDTQIIAVEWWPGHPEVYQKMCRTLSKLNFKKPPICINKELQTIDLKSLGLQIDFAFLDICGVMTERYAKWIENQLMPCLSEYANVSFTFQTARRNSHYIKQRMGLTKNGAQFLRRYNIHGHGGVEPTTIIIGDMFKNHDFNLYYDFYQDAGSIEMFQVHLRGIHLSDGDPLDTYFVTEEKPMNKRSEAARKANITRGAAGRRAAGQKAAETRKANALKRKRSEAAKKAAATRKANALRAKRSAAAKKANETRGAKGRRQAALKAAATRRQRAEK